MRGTVFASLVIAGWIAAAASPVSAQRAGTESAAQNVRESQQYEQLVCSNPAFRERRMREECGPITDPQLRQSCLASFNCGPGGPAGQNWRGAPASERMR
ncbi:MAG: hypothetical protein AB7H90_09740 [Alphaproteobacteria bacterium]